MALSKWLLANGARLGRYGRFFVLGLALQSVLFTSVSAIESASPRIYLERVGNFGVVVRVDTPFPVNAYNIEIGYDPKIAEVESVDTSRSLITLRPKPLEAREGKITIKGGSTVPFSGIGGEVLSFELRPVAQGVMEFDVRGATAYQADGQGTPLGLSASPLPLRITPGTFIAYEEQLATRAAATSPAPKITLASIESDPLQYGNRLLVFQAEDQSAGIARYEAREKSWLLWSPWREAMNPYPIDSGVWAVQLKAVSNSGGQALATVYQLGAAIWKAGLAVVLIGLLVLWWLSTRRRRETEV